ncbi:MAG: hypothetical protein II411_03365 [Lachnospiraceae bacterium]|nr:hypothetical protein [Lachnospiraceae bacterium]
MNSVNAMLREKIQDKWYLKDDRKIRTIFYICRTDYGADVYGINGSSGRMMGIALVDEDYIEVIC